MKKSRFSEAQIVGILKEVEPPWVLRRLIVVSHAAMAYSGLSR